ncbi:MAG: PilZ domain-containing protein [Planctomycetota bacterium]|jgi:hypothetical protein
MSEKDLRRTSRVACNLPLQVQRPAGWPEVEVVDASRTGVRLRMSVSALGLQPPVSLGSIARQLGESLSSDLLVAFDPDRLGTLVPRRLDVVRIGPRSWESDLVEFGCTITPPLDAEEVAALGLPLEMAAHPPHALSENGHPHTAEEELGAVPVATTHTDAVPETMDALLVPRAGTDTPPLFAHVDQVGEASVLLHARAVPPIKVPKFRRRVAALAMGVQRAYGTEPRLQLSRNGRPAWTGEARFESLEVLSKPRGHFLLGFSLPDALPPGARRELGLPAA